MISFVVNGDPVPAARARAAVIDGKPRMYTPKGNRQYVDDVRIAFQRRQQDEPVRRDGGQFEKGVPVRIDAIFYFQRPKGHYGTGRNAEKLKASAPEFHTTKPDVDNLLKLLKDALKGFAWHDDSQVVGYGTVEKKYADERPRTEIRIYEAKSADTHKPADYWQPVLSVA